MRVVVVSDDGALADELPDSLTAFVTGPAGLTADLSEGFGGIDSLLLGVAFLAVLLILLVIGAFGAFSLKADGVAQTVFVLTVSEARDGQQKLSERFAAGCGNATNLTAVRSRSLAARRFCCASENPQELKLQDSQRVSPSVIVSVACKPRLRATATEGTFAGLMFATRSSTPWERNQSHMILAASVANPRP